MSEIKDEAVAPSPWRLDLRGSRILVVDDTPANIDVLYEVLNAAGYEVAAATSGETALETARNGKPDLVLLDVMMTEMDGFEVCRRFRADPLLADVPIIFLSANAEADAIVDGFDVGGQDYITKPFQNKELLARVHNQLERARLATSLDELTTRLERRVERISVLLIDDQPIVGEAVRRMLAKEEDIDFHFESDPRAAERRVSETRPSVILLDMVMPGVDGLELLDRIRANPATRHIPVVLLTSKDDPVAKSEAFAKGATDYLVKLPAALELAARIRHYAAAYMNLLQSQHAYAELKKSESALERSNSFIRQVFGRYLSDQVVDSLLDSPGSLNMGGELRKVTILMADLRGFTAISEHLAPDTTVTLLNNYLSAMTEIIVEYEGTIDEFIGDAILAVFGAPILHDDDADRAIACAIAMQRAMPQVNAHNTDLGLPEVAMGIGLHTGEVVVGNIGSETRAKYGIVGRHVNLTARIESYTVGGQVFASADTREDAAADLRVAREFQVEPKGLSQKLTVCELIGIGPPFDLQLPQQEAETPRSLETPLEVRFRVLNEKDVSGSDREGAIVALGDHTAILQTDFALSSLDNLRIAIHDDTVAAAPEFYAKVIESRTPQAWLLGVTSMPDSLVLGE